MVVTGMCRRVVAGVALLPLLASIVSAHGFPGPQQIRVTTTAGAPTAGRDTVTPRGSGDSFTGSGRTTPSGAESRTTPSPARAQRTTIDWVGTDLPRRGSDGYASEQALPLSFLAADSHRPAKAKAGRPTLVYFASTADDMKLQVFEGLFLDERIGVSGRFFNMLRISLDDLPRQDQKVYGDGSNGPKFVVLDASGAEVATLDGWRTTAPELLKVMEPQVKATYAKDLKRVLEAESKILDTLDKTHYELEILAAQRKVVAERLAEKECASCRKVMGKLESKIARTEKEREEAVALEAKVLGQL